MKTSIGVKVGIQGQSPLKHKNLYTSMPINVGISRRVGPYKNMRIGKLQFKILKALYNKEKQQREKIHFMYNGMRPKKIIEEIVNLKWPKEKEFGINRIESMGNGFKYFSLLEKVKDPKEREKIYNKDPIIKKRNKINKKIAKWHKETNAIYRALKLLQKKKLIITPKEKFRAWGYKSCYILTETGRRIISHRLNNNLPPKKTNNLPHNSMVDYKINKE